MPTFSELLINTHDDHQALLALSHGARAAHVAAKPPAPVVSPAPAAQVAASASFAHLNPPTGGRVRHQQPTDAPAAPPAEPTADDLARSVVAAMKTTRRTIRL